jgi:predicted transcriptional regulator
MLSQRNQSKISIIAYQSNTNHSYLNDHLDFMIEQGLIEKKAIGKEKAYCITKQGSTILTSFNQFKLSI